MLEEAVLHGEAEAHTVLLLLLDVPELHVLVLGQALCGTGADLLGDTAALCVASVDHLVRIRVRVGVGVWVGVG